MKNECNHNIKCDACNCVYHDGDCKCMADSIKVGTENACCCDDTRCGTFKMKGEDGDPTIYSPLV